MNRETYTIPKKILRSLLARLGLKRQPAVPDPLPRLSEEQLSGMVETLVDAQGGEPPDLSPEEEAIKRRLLAETKQINGPRN